MTMLYWIFGPLGCYTYESRSIHASIHASMVNMNESNIDHVTYHQ